jgi:group I intron endonuclease
MVIGVKPEELIPLEQDCIDTLNPYFNICKKAGSSFGVKLSKETLRKMSKAQSGENNPNFGKKLTEEHKQKLSEVHKQRWKKVDRSTLNWSASDETRAKMRAARLGKKRPTTICPHCDKEGAVASLKRYHFDNCKHK